MTQDKKKAPGATGARAAAIAALSMVIRLYHDRIPLSIPEVIT